MSESDILIPDLSDATVAIPTEQAKEDGRTLEDYVRNLIERVAREGFARKEEAP